MKDTRKQNILTAIQRIAIELTETDSTNTRADLAYDLREYGVERDGLEVGQLIRDAYEHFGKDERIRRAFVDNEGKQQVVDEFEIASMMKTGDTGSVFQLVDSRLTQSGHTLDKLNKLIEGFAQNVVLNVNPDYLKMLAGTYGVTKVGNEASMYFNAYEILVGEYGRARGDVKAAMEDFVELRSHVNAVYTKYAMQLVDLYGDGIKAVAPNLFDFSSTEFLDVDGMLEAVKLDYDRLAESCASLVGELREDFAASLAAAAGGCRAAGGKRAGLIVAAWAMVSHYLNAGEKQMACERELEVMKRNIKHDVTTIRGDYGRLAVIYKTLCDLYIPKANIFFRHGGNVLNEEVDQLFAELYSDEKVRELQVKRDEMVQQRRGLENAITDLRLNIHFYKEDIGRCETFLNAKRADYEQAVQAKPKEPSLLSKIFTLGRSRREYDRSFYEWHKTCYPVVEEYEKYLEDVTLERSELASAEESLQARMQESDRLLRDIEAASRQMRESLLANTEVKTKVAAHLTDIVKLLRIGKSILESKLDDRHIRTVNIKDYRDVELPDDITRGISDLTQALKSAHPAGELRPARGLAFEKPNASSENAQEDIPGDALTETVENQSSHTEQTDKGLDLAEQWVQLQAMKKQGLVTGEAYDRQLQRLQNRFNAELKAIDRKGAALCETLKRVNAAADSEQLKNALLELGKGSPELKDIDLDALLSGKQVIEL